LPWTCVQTCGHLLGSQDGTGFLRLTRLEKSNDGEPFTDKNLNELQTLVAAYGPKYNPAKRLLEKLLETVPVAA
jgi:hypothetical protein